MLNPQKLNHTNKMLSSQVTLHHYPSIHYVTSAAQKVTETTVSTYLNILQNKVFN
jgi:hypothetical protein